MWRQQGEGVPGGAVPDFQGSGLRQPEVQIPYPKDPLVFDVDLDGVVADFYGKMREMAAEWLERPAIVEKSHEDNGPWLP